MGNQPASLNGAGSAPPSHHDDPRQRGGGYGGAGGGYIQPTGAPTYSQQQQQQHQQQQHGRGGRGMEGMQRSGSDASMTMLDEQQLQQQLLMQQQASEGGGSGAEGGGSSKAIETLLDDDTVPTVFRWEHGGRQVYITGTFNGWSRQIPMHRSGNDFTYIHNLKRGKHAFKFIVDDEWRFAPDQPTVADIEGRINNFIDVTDFKPYTGDREFEKEKAAAEYGAVPIKSSDTAGGATTTAGTSAATASNDDENKLDEGGDGSDASDGMGGAARPDKDGEVFSHTMPDLDDYTKEPPPLPPHLRHIILNKPPQLQDTAALPVPQHVALNHLYCTAIKDNMMVLGITQRFKTKFVTTVYYSPCSSK